MGLPRKLTHFALFQDGVSHVGEVPEVTPPKLTRKMEDYRSGGMNLPVKADYGMEPMEMEWTAAGYMRDLFTSWGAPRHDAVLLRFVGALQRDDAESVDSIEIVVRGRHSELDPGNAKAAEQTAFKVKSALSYYKLIMNGETLIEIDAVALVENVGGVDRLAQVRAILGV
ncbi:phage major tail tube protein [Paracidovorax citrulli]|uniref:phage major tail tube protein n=1 Tax=Paracidovorax citrulli TaxID=80869 RepID=UPI0005FB4A51|nr:phage major tail tube protein [Paracidovorax citrulli]